jgi:hypothetical protein
MQLRVHVPAADHSMYATCPQHGGGGCGSAPSPAATSCGSWGAIMTHSTSKQRPDASSTRGGHQQQQLGNSKGCWASGGGPQHHLCVVVPSSSDAAATVAAGPMSARRVLAISGGELDGVASWLEQQVSQRQGLQGRLVSASSHRNLLLLASPEEAEDDDVSMGTVATPSTAGGGGSRCGAAASGGSTATTPGTAAEDACASSPLPAPAFQLLGLL